ncbi:MAG: glycosyltransferase family 1 protein [Bacteroidales bacterium]
MNIVVNVQLLLPEKLDGIGWFTFETISRITRWYPEHKFILVFDRKPHASLQFPENTRCVVLPPKSRHPFLWFLRFEILLPFFLKNVKADVFVSPDGWMTLNASVPCVQVLHDLNFVHKPEGLPFWTRHYYLKLFPRYARQATKIGTVSDYSKQDIIQSYGVAPEKVEVMHNGCNTSYRPLGEKQDQITRMTFTAGKPFLLYVGALIPRKNIIRMLKAFDRFKEKDTRNMKLLIVGGKKNIHPHIAETIENITYKEDVVFLGRRQLNDLVLLYSAAEALVFVPTFEGFGIPILEAFNAETPVITSNVSSMPEVAGEAALLINPFSVDSITQAMTHISTDAELRENLIAKGRLRKKCFSWDITAQKLWNTIEAAVQTKSGDI